MNKRLFRPRLAVWLLASFALVAQAQQSINAIPLSDDVQPKGLFAPGALTYKANKRPVFDAGMRFGLNPDAPRVGVFAGFTVGVIDFYKKR